MTVRSFVGNFVEVVVVPVIVVMSVLML